MDLWCIVVYNTLENRVVTKTIFRNCYYWKIYNNSGMSFTYMNSIKIKALDVMTFSKIIFVKINRYAVVPTVPMCEL